MNHFYSYNSAKAETWDPSCTAQNISLITQMFRRNLLNEDALYVYPDALHESEDRDKELLQGGGTCVREQNIGVPEDKDDTNWASSQV